MSLLRTTRLAITTTEFAHWLAPFLHHHRRRGIPATNVQDSDQPHSTQYNDNIDPCNLGIAVSGGVDSMALATLLSKYYSPQKTTRLHALIVDHKLRDSSTEEACSVAQQVKRLGITPHVLTLDWSTSRSNPSCINDDGRIGATNTRAIDHKPDKIQLETRARLERYKAIAQRCHTLQIRDLFVGHHAGDQVETTLFRFTRASGIDGLAGIQGVAPVGVVNVPEALEISVIRPLLNVSKDRLQATCEEEGTKWVEDESNKSLDYQRNVIRRYQQHIDSSIG
ncbi:hypothetical protein BGX28_009330 [Mortierella sp. GBA30]|nr:hypothetical protein BGX28_009330 [Mortierella sp. GBA30]